MSLKKKLSLLFVAVTFGAAAAGCGDNSAQPAAEAAVSQETEAVETETTQAENNHVDTTAADLEKLPQEIKDVLWENAPFYDTAEKKEFTRETYQVTKETGELSTGVLFDSYRVIDLEQDGSPELLVDLTLPEGNYDINGYEDGRIFSCVDGCVYAYPTWFRHTGVVFENGIAVSSGGASWNTFYRYHFTKTEAEEEELFRSEDDVYYIGEEQVDLETWQKYAEELIGGAPEVHLGDNLEDVLENKTED